MVQYGPSRWRRTVSFTCLHYVISEVGISYSVVPLALSWRYRLKRTKKLSISVSNFCQSRLDSVLSCAACMLPQESQTNLLLLGVLDSVCQLVQCVPHLGSGHRCCGIVKELSRAIPSVHTFPHSEEGWRDKGRIRGTRTYECGL